MAQMRFGKLRNGGIRICEDCHEVTLEDETHLCPGKKEEGEMEGEFQFKSSSYKNIISHEDAEAYFKVVTSAFEVYLDREAIRHALWKDYPARDQFNQIKIKVDRILRSIERIELLESAPLSELGKSEVARLKENIKEESSDIINYAIFGVRQL